MKKNSIFFICLSALLLLSGCATQEISPEEEAKRKEIQEKQERIASIRRRFNQVHSLIEKGDYPQAASYLALLKEIDYKKDNIEFYLDELKILEQTLDGAKKITNATAINTLTEKRMLNEIDYSLNLPATYNKTVVIDANLPPVETPLGPMEAIVNQPVSITLDDAGIAELVGALRASCKINVIADQALSENKKLSIAVEKVPLREVLNYISRNMGIAFHLGEHILWITKSETTSGGPLLENRLFHLRHGTIPKTPTGGPGAPGAEMGDIGNVEPKEDKDLETMLKTFQEKCSPEGCGFEIFHDRNLLWIRDSHENMRLIEEIVKDFDNPPYQVCIEARFITVSQNDLKDVGTEITQLSSPLYHGETRTETAPGVYTSSFSEVSDTALKVVNSMTSLGALDAGSENGVGLVNFSGVLGDRTYDILISALDKKASSVTLSVPKVTVLNNRQARIRNGQNIYYFKEYDVANVDRGDQGSEKVVVPTGDPTELKCGLTFDVSVNVGNNGRTILLGLKPQIVEFDSWEYYMTNGSDDDDDDDDDAASELGQIKLPKTKERSVITTVNIASGQTVVLGGTLENAKGTTVTKVPILGDIPLLGFFFRHEVETQTPVNLLIFVTATVINEKGESVDVRPESASKK